MEIQYVWDIEIDGIEIYLDRSGVGQGWVNADSDNTPANIVDEIACEIRHRGVKETDRFTASNGMRYRW